MSDSQIRRLAARQGCRAFKWRGMWYVADGNNHVQTYHNGLDAEEVVLWLTQPE